MPYSCGAFYFGAWQDLTPSASDIPIKNRPLKGLIKLASLRQSMSFKTTKPSKEFILILITKLFHGALNEEIKYPTIERFITASTFSERPTS